MIPKSIMQYWEGPLTADIEELMRSWRKLNPDYKYELFNRDSALKYLEKHYGRSIVSAFSSAILPAMQSDIFRVAWILRDGGIYIDVATKCIHAIDDLTCGSRELVLIKKWHGRVCNGFIASKSDNPIVTKYFNAIIRNVLDAKISDVWSASGPGVLISVLSNETKFTVIDQFDAKNYFLFINDLPHKRELHWSKKQKNQPIYLKDNLAVDKVSIHLGPHKTGTTLIQTHLESVEHLLNDQDIGIITVRSKNSQNYLRERTAYTKALQGYLVSDGSVKQKELFAKKMQMSLENMILNHGSKFKHLLISDENLLGPLLGHRFAGGHLVSDCYLGAPLVFDVMNNLQKDRLISIIMVRRDFYSWRISVYKNLVTNYNEHVSPTKFVNRISSDSNKQYDSIFSALQNYFGQRARILDSSDFFSLTHADLLNKFLKSCNIDFNFDGTVEKLHIKNNASASWQSIEYFLTHIHELDNISKRRLLLKDVINGEKECSATEIFMSEVDKCFYKNLNL